MDTIAQGNAIAATAATLCPIGIASALGVNPDSFLVAVAIAASCAFLTPIEHQNNTLILGLGGFRFGDCWKLGVPLEVLVGAVSIPLLLIIWPLQCLPSYNIFPPTMIVASMRVNRLRPSAMRLDAGFLPRRA